MNISFDVKNQIITRTDRNRVVANSTDYLAVDVTFSEDWDDCDKQLNFKNGNMEYSYQLEDDSIPATAHLNLGVGTWKVYAIGTNGEQRILTNSVNLVVVASGYVGTDGPTPSVYDQLLVIINSLHTEAASEAIIRSAVEAYVSQNIVAIINDYLSNYGGFDELVQQAIEQYLSDEIDATTVNGHSVDKDVPSDAVFTDTVYDDSDARIGIDGTAYATLGEAIRGQINDLKKLIYGGDKVADDFTITTGDSRSSDGVNPPSSTLTATKTISLANLDEYSELTFDWNNESSLNSYGLIRAYYTFNNSNVDLYNYYLNHVDVNVNPESGSVVIPLNSRVGSTGTITFTVVAKSAGYSTTAISRGTLNVSKIVLK